MIVLGTGETGMDIAYEAVKAGAEEVVLCSRGGYARTSWRSLQFQSLIFAHSFLSFPKALVILYFVPLNRALDCSCVLLE